MKSWITRLARAGWCVPSAKTPRAAPLVRARPDWPSAASKRCWPSNCASATPPRPPPKRQRNSRRERNGEKGVFIGCLIDEHEFVAVEDKTTEVGQTVLVRVGGEFRQFRRCRRSAQSEFISERDLLIAGGG